MNLSPQTKSQFKILLSMYLGYGAMMICRQMITILGPAMLADESLGLTKTNLGDFAAYGTIGALVGKLIWGPLTDKFGGRLTFLVGITTTALLVIAFGYSPNIASFTFFSFLIYCLKSSGWPGLTKLIGNWYHPHKYGQTWSIVSTSSRASVVAATLFFGYLLSFMSWRFVGVTAAVTALSIVVFCYFFMQEKPEDPQFIEKDAGSTNDAELAKDAEEALENLRNHPLKEVSLAQGLLTFAKSHRVWLIITMMMMLTCLMAFLDFVGVYLQEVFSLTASKATMASSVFPTGSLAGLILSIIFYDRFSKRKIRTILTLTMVVAAACIFTLKFLPSFNLSPELNFQVALVCIFLFGLAISPAYYIPMSIFSIEFGGPHSATLICLLDAFGFGASAAFGFIGGRLADSPGGWDSFMNMIIVLVLIAIISVWGFMHGEYKVHHK